MIIDFFPVIPNSILHSIGPVAIGLVVLWLTLFVLLVLVKDEKLHDKIAIGVISGAFVVLLAFFIVSQSPF